MTTQGDPRGDLAAALQAVRAAVAEVDYPLPLPSAAPARAAASAVLAQLDEYALPRLADLQAPLLVVVGGSTGAGKSTLVNSLVRAPVSPAGVLRPTTRTPVLVCHPADAPWFRGRAHQLITAPALPAGLAFLDAPDIDSVEDANRALAPRLFDAADLWLFLTTPTRYADAVPWRLLRTARERGTAIALVLSRVPPPVAVDVVTLLADLLTEQGLGKVPLFVLPEARVDRQGLLPEPATEPLRTWFEALAGDATAREDVVRCTLDGALAGLPLRLAELAEAADEQLTAAEALAEQVGVAYGLARGTVERGLAVGAAGSQPAGEDRGGPARVARWARRLALRRPLRLVGRAGERRARHRRSATEAGLVTLVRGAAADAADQVGIGWRTHPAGSALAAADHRRRGAWPDLPALSPELARQVQRVVREERGDLRTRLAELFDAEAARWLERLGDVPSDGMPGQRLRDSAVALERARQAARLAAPDTADRWTAVATDPSRYAPHAEDAPAAEGVPEARPAAEVVPAAEVAPHAEDAPVAEGAPGAQPAAAGVPEAEYAPEAQPAAAVEEASP